MIIDASIKRSGAQAIRVVGADWCPAIAPRGANIGDDRCDFVVKPWTNQTLVESVTRHARRAAEARLRERRYAYEVEQVREMFHRFVPDKVVGAPGTDIAASSENLETVGGDYFEVLHQGSKTAICVGDVIGKGFSAAFLLSSQEPDGAWRVEQPKLFMANEKCDVIDTCLAVLFLVRG